MADRYRVANWSSYNKSLVARGSVTLWLDSELSERWHEACSRSGRGRTRRYSDVAIALCLTVRSLYRLPLRATQGFVASVLERLGLGLDCPDYTTLCRRQAGLAVTLPRLKPGDRIDVVIDATGLKVYGEGEWKTKCYGAGKRRVWRKLHLAVDPLSHEVVSFELTMSGTDDAKSLPGLLGQIGEEVGRVFADGAYDTTPCYEACHERGISLVTPPRRSAVPDPPDAEHVPRTPRTRAIERIRTLSETIDEEEARKQWKIEADYHTRSLAETAMFRFKTAFTGTLQARKLSNQHTEATLKCAILNKFTQLGMPISVPA